MRDLPERPSLEHYRREAKELVSCPSRGRQESAPARGGSVRPRPLPARREVLARGSLYRYTLSDRGRAIEKSSKPPGWREAAERVVEPMNVDR